MYLPDRVYPDLKAGGQGISLSLKIVDFFAGKVGTNAPQATSSSSSPIELFSRMVGKAYMLYDKDINKPWSRGAATLAHLYYSLGASSRVNAKGIACYTTLLESWIFEYFPKLPSIPTPNQSAAAEFCTRWSWTKTTSAQSGSAALNMFREALDSYKLQDVEVPHSQNEGGGGPAEVAEDPTRSVLVEALAAKVCTLTNFLSYSCIVIHILGRELPYNNFVTCLLLLQTRECAFLIEANLKMQADIQAKDITNSICGKKLNEKILECESKKKMVEDLQIQLADKVKKYEMLSSINNKLMEEVYVKVTHDKWYVKYIHKTKRLGVWRLALKGTIEGGDFKDTEDPTYDELSRQFTELLTIAQEGPKGEYKDDIILSGSGEYQEMIDSRLKKIDHKTNLRQTLFQPFNWFQLDIRDVERNGNTTFRVAASYAYKSQMKFLNVKDSLCTLMSKKPSYWKSVFSQRLDVAYNDLGERRMTSDENFVNLETKYQSPIPPVSKLWWAQVQLDIPDAFVKPCVKNYFDPPNEVWMKLQRDNNVNLQDYNINDLFS
ncbi:hypothetical protein GIB67_009966 [Kingdonia uniflora]|uniref:Uncharacterized protein n=1 Tax=Kingdonia uniflora TaxID=39325 RepID=A0A7J7L953_9MAGN|nr:hypothetical protein GIB67_009966 [Kingdonia uniflora]